MKTKLCNVIKRLTACVLVATLLVVGGIPPVRAEDTIYDENGNVSINGVNREVTVHLLSGDRIITGVSSEIVAQIRISVPYDDDWCASLFLKCQDTGKNYFIGTANMTKDKQTVVVAGQITAKAADIGACEIIAATKVADHETVNDLLTFSNQCSKDFYIVTAETNMLASAIKLDYAYEKTTSLEGGGGYAKVKATGSGVSSEDDSWNDRTINNTVQKYTQVTFEMSGNPRGYPTEVPWKCTIDATLADYSVKNICTMSGTASGNSASFTQSIRVEDEYQYITGAFEVRSSGSFGSTESASVSLAVVDPPYQTASFSSGVSANGIPSSVQVDYGTTYTPTARPTASGYTFNGWSPSSAVMDSDKTFTATWTPNTYYVAFHANDGTGSMSNQTYRYGTAQALTANTFTRPGYTFGGWARSAAGGKTYNDRQSVSNLTTSNGGTVTLYAVWNPIPPSPASISSVSGDSATYDYVEGDLVVSVNAQPAADDSPISKYQWYRNTTASTTGGTLIDGAIEASYTLPVGMNVGKYYYYCIISTQHTLNSTTTDTTSSIATVDITLIPPTINYADETIKVPQGIEWQIGASGWTPSTDSDADVDISSLIPDAGQPDATLSYRLAATDEHSVSAEESLVIPVRPATPNTPFLLEKGSALLRVLNPNDYPDAEYAAQESGVNDALSWQSTTDFLSAAADKIHTVYVRVKSGATSFASKIYSKAVHTLGLDKTGTLAAREAATIDGALATNTDGDTITFGASTITLPAGADIVDVQRDGVCAPVNAVVHNGTVIVDLSNGGVVHADSSITASVAEIYSVVFTAPNSGMLTVNADGSVTLPAGGEVSIAGTTIKLKDGGTVTANADGTLTFAPGATLLIGSNTIILTDGGTFLTDGSITAQGHVQINEIQVTAPTGMNSTIHADGAIFMPSGSIFQTPIISPELGVPYGGEITAGGDIEAYGAVKASELLIQTPNKETISINPDTGVGVLIKNTTATTDIADITLINGGMLGPDGTITLIGSIKNHNTIATSPQGAKLVISTEGTTEIPAGGSATVNGNKIEMPKGGRVNPDGSVTVYGQITVGDITIIPPEDDGFTVDPDGTIHIPDGSVAEDTNGNHFELPDGGIITPDGDIIISGGITIGTTTVTPPAGGNLIINADGTVTAPANSTVDNSANGLHGDMPEGGTLNPDGSVTVENTLIVGTTTAVPPAGEHIIIDPDGIVHIPAGGSVIINGETITLPDGGILNPDGSVTIAQGSSITQNGTTIIFPDGATINPDGSISGGSITVGDKDYTLPDGGNITVDASGDIIVQPGKPVEIDGTTITPPADESIVIHPDGTVTIPADSTVNRGDKDFELSDEATLQPDGSITTGGSITIGGTVITPPAGGELVINPDGTIHIPGGGTIIAGDGNIIVTIPEGGADVDFGADGSFTIPDGSTVIVGGNEVDADGGIVNPDGTITLPDGGIVQPDGSIIYPPKPTPTPTPTPVPTPTPTPDNPNNNSGNSGGGSSGGGSDGSGSSGAANKPQNDLPFVDVEQDDWYYPSVKYVYENELLNGTSETTFSPETAVSRAMVAAILHRMAGEPAATDVSLLSKYAYDVSPDAWYAPAVLWCIESGNVKGYGDGTFRPNAPVTREETVTMLHRYLGTQEVPLASVGFADILSAYSRCG